jgi:hypothetical protein
MQDQGKNSKVLTNYQVRQTIYYYDHTSVETNSISSNNHPENQG